MEHSVKVCSINFLVSVRTLTALASFKAPFKVYIFFSKNTVIIIWLFFIVRIDYIKNGGIIYGNYA